MIMMVLNKSKLKKIIIWVLVVVAFLSGAIFFMTNKDTKPTFKLFDQANIPYTQGTKQQNFNIELLKKLSITLPSNLEEQEKIGRR